MVQIQPCTQVNENEKSCRVEFVDLREEKVSLMRMKVSDYIAQKLVDEGITDAFMVTGTWMTGLDTSRDCIAILTITSRPVPSQPRPTRGSITRSRLAA